MTKKFGWRVTYKDGTVSVVNDSTLIDWDVAVDVDPVYKKGDKLYTVEELVELPLVPLEVELTGWALNEASWAVIKGMAERNINMPPDLYNNLKYILKPAVETYLKEITK